MNILTRLVLLFMLFLTSQSGIATTTEFTGREYDVNHIALGEEIYGYDTTSNPRHCCQVPSSVNTQDRSFLAFVSDFLATKNVGPTLSTLHTRGTKIPGGRKIGDTLAGSNKIKNANGDTFKRVDFAPSKPHNGLSPHTHPNFRNQLPDGSFRFGVSRHAEPVTRRDIIDAARQGGQRTGGL